MNLKEAFEVWLQNWKLSKDKAPCFVEKKLIISSTALKKEGLGSVPSASFSSASHQASSSRQIQHGASLGPRPRNGSPGAAGLVETGVTTSSFHEAYDMKKTTEGLDQRSTHSHSELQSPSKVAKETRAHKLGVHVNIPVIPPKSPASPKAGQSSKPTTSPTSPVPQLALHKLEPAFPDPISAAEANAKTNKAAAEKAAADAAETERAADKAAADKAAADKVSPE
jgi:hypothetical protein